MGGYVEVVRIAVLSAGYALDNGRAVQHRVAQGFKLGEDCAFDDGFSDGLRPT